MIVNFETRYIEGIIKLWNHAAVDDGYKELTTESFIGIFTGNPYFKAENTFVSIDDGDLFQPDYASMVHPRHAAA